VIKPLNDKNREKYIKDSTIQLAVSGLITIIKKIKIDHNNKVRLTIVNRHFFKVIIYNLFL